jgi:S1-C subfamily serine protease
MRRTLSTTLVTALCGGLAGGLIALALDGDPAASSSAGAPASAAAAPAASTGGAALTPAQTYSRDAPGVVVITATQTEKVPSTLFSPPSTQSVQSLGSGFVIDRQGDIVTNDHVVTGAKGVRVGFSGGSSYPAKIVGTDPSTDLAVVRVGAPASALHPLAFGDSASAAVGDPVYAIGNPFGLDRTMTAGIVSATGRDIQAPNRLTIPNAIQTDAPINHGNSGGPLLDARGHVIGVNSQIEGGTVDANVGVGFAIPSNMAQSVAKQLIARGSVEHGWLGVEVQTIDPGLSKVVRGLPASGVVVASVVRNGPAAKAGIEAAKRQVTVNGATALLGGDSIVAVDGKPVHSATQLADAIAGRKPGDRISLEVVRGGSTRQVEVTLANMPAQEQ